MNGPRIIGNAVQLGVGAQSLAHRDQPMAHVGHQFHALPHHAGCVIVPFMRQHAGGDSDEYRSKNEFFQNNAYHIANTDGNAVAVVLAGQIFTIPNAYTLSMWEVKGDDTSTNNSFGMIMRFSQQKKGTQTVTTFYSFEVVNINGGEYRFYKYDDSQGSPSKAWTELWHMPFGHEYHQGQGVGKTNTIRIYQNGPNFTFTVNGKVVGNAHDGTLTSGMVGMLVNLKGTEVTFSNMQITRK